MKANTKITRLLSGFLMVAILLTALIGCDNGNAPVVNTPTATEAQTDEDTPKEPINLNDYFIIVPDFAMNKSVEGLAANELRAMLADLGYSVRIKDDNGSVEEIGENVILLGKTVATDMEMPAENVYSVVEKNGRIQILANNYYGYVAAIKFIKSKIKQAGGFPRGFDRTETFSTAQANKASDSLRVMFYNVYANDDWKNVDGTTVTGANAPAAAMRQDMQSDLLSIYQPDVVGFQEYSPNTYHSKFNSVRASLGYEQVAVSVGSANWTPIFYNPDRIAVKDCGYELYRVNGGKTKSITWAILEEKTGENAGELFAVFNTHFEYHPGSQGGDEYRASNVEDMLAVINRVTGSDSEYANVPVIMGGDLNFWDIWGIDKDDSLNDASDKWVGQNGIPYTMLTEGGLRLASKISGVQTNAYTSVNSYHGYYRYDATTKLYDLTKSTLTHSNSSPYTLDHIFLGGNMKSIKVSRYMIIEDDITLRASDHSPTLLDFTLK